MKEIHYFATLQSDSNRVGHKVKQDYLLIHPQEFQINRVEIR
jgi:hypothetical protein